MYTDGRLLRVLLIAVEVSLLPTCTMGEADITEETLNLLSGGKYILRDGGWLKMYYSK